jgi:sucrose-6-phosphate hydrolase SacC (GH32 family)
MLFYPRNLKNIKYDKKYVIKLPTYEKSGQAVHPDISYSPTRNPPYIIAFTPYPFSIDKYENPSIAVSHNGLRFFEEIKGINPLAPPPSIDHNDDPDFFEYENKYAVMYLETLRPEKQNLILLESYDRKKWVSRIVHCDYLKAGDPMIVSPAYANIKHHDYLYYVDKTKTEYTIQYVNIGKGFSPDFTNRHTITLSGEMPKSAMPWHIDIISNNETRYMLICFLSKQQGKTIHDLYIAQSTDGVDWRLSNKTLLKNAYRSSGFIVGDDVYIYYSAKKSYFAMWETGVIKKRLNAFFN